MSDNGAAWIGVDLDGTLAVYDGWKGIEHIGEPIAPVVELVQHLIASGIRVKVFTARVGEGIQAFEPIYEWCRKNLGIQIEVTNRKDFSMVGLIDDRAVTVENNTGKFLSPLPDYVATIAWHWSPENPNAPTYKGVK